MPLSTHQRFAKIMRELSKELGEPDPEDMPIIRRLFDAGVEAGRAETGNKKKREHVLEPCDQTLMCSVCLHVEWMDDSLPDECPGPDATAAPAANTQEVCRSPGPTRSVDEQIQWLAHRAMVLITKSADGTGEALSGNESFRVALRELLVTTQPDKQGTK